jgi:hypothetical protein
MDRKWDLRKTSYLAVVLFLISLIPVLLVLPCVYPQADDFSYGREIYAVWRSGHSAWSVFLQAFATVKRYYTTWQGTYTSIFLMALMPASFSMAAYHAVPLVMIALLTVSLYCLLRELLSGWFEMPGWFVCGVTAVLAFAMIQGMPDKTEAFTWYNAAIHYTGMESLWMFYMASLFAAMRKNRAGRKTAPVLLSCALAFLAAGGNNITVLFALLADALLLIFLLIFRKRYGQYFRPALPSAVCLAAGAAANFLAPGNMQRLLYSGGNDCSAPLTVLRALETGALKAVRWCDGLTVMTVVLLLPFVWYLVRTPQIRRYRFPLPGLVAFSAGACIPHSLHRIFS